MRSAVLDDWSELRECAAHLPLSQTRSGGCTLISELVTGRRCGLRLGGGAQLVGLRASQAATWESGQSSQGELCSQGARQGAQVQCTSERMAGKRPIRASNRASVSSFASREELLAELLAS